MPTEINPADVAMSDTEAAAEARRIIADFATGYQPTSFRDDTPIPTIGTTPPVPQPDTRIAPQWAVGLAVASIGVGAGSTGLGCAAWLLFKGLSMVSVPGLERFAWIIIAPFAGAAMVLTALGGAISKAKRAALPDVHNHNGPEYHEHHTTNSRSIWAKTINNQ